MECGRYPRVMGAADPNRAAARRLVQRSRRGRLDRLFDEHQVSVATVFGSAVVGHPEALGGAASEQPAGQARDLDVAIAFRAGAGRGLVAFLDALASDIGPVELDGLDLDRAGIVAEAEALTRCVPLFEDESGGFARRQIPALARRLDTAHLRRLDLEILAAGPAR